MKKVSTLSTLCLAALLAIPAWADEKGGKGETKGHSQNVVVGKDGQITIYVTESAEPGEKGKHKVQVRKFAVQPVAEAKGWHKVEKKAPGTWVMVKNPKGPKAASAAGGAWLGIRVSPVPAATAAQLGLKGRGVMIANLVKGSPAQKAGLDRYDVVVAVGKGEPVKDVGGFIARIRSCKPGQPVPMTVLRTGKETSVTVVLGKGPGAEAGDYVYKEDADELWQDQFKLHRGLIRKGPKGWTFEGGKGGRIELPMEMLKALPKGPWPDIQVRVGSRGGGKTTFKVARTVDGRTVEVESADDGGIVVRRSDKSGGKKLVTRKYKSPEALRKLDPEAHALYEGVRVSKRGAGAGALIFGGQPWVLHGKVPAAAAKRLEKELQAQLKKLTERAGELARHAKGGADVARLKIARAIEPAPRRKFEVDEEGRIAVEVREGDSSAKLTFRNEAEMRKKAPKLYRAYEKLLKDSR